MKLSDILDPIDILWDSDRKHYLWEFRTSFSFGCHFHNFCKCGDTYQNTPSRVVLPDRTIWISLKCQDMHWLMWTMWLMINHEVNYSFNFHKNLAINAWIIRRCKIDVIDWKRWGVVIGRVYCLIVDSECINFSLQTPKTRLNGKLSSLIEYIPFW